MKKYENRDKLINTESLINITRVCDVAAASCDFQRFLIIFGKLITKWTVYFESGASPFSFVSRKLKFTLNYVISHFFKKWT